MPNDNVLTADARATIMDACQSISRSADGLKAGCAIGDEWPDAEDKAFYDGELRLLERLTALLAHPGQPEPRPEVTEQPSLTNPLTPYGMLVRALRIVAQTSLYDMGQALLLSPAKLSAMEFGREPLTPEIVREVGTYFESLGIHNMRPVLQFAADGDGGDTSPFESRDERDEFIRACQDFDDDGETDVDHGLLMKWANDGLLDCDHFTITKKGRAAIDAARKGEPQ